MSNSAQAQAQPKPGKTIVWRWDGSDSPVPKIPHTGSCHCGTVRFRFPHEDPTRQPGWHVPVKNCNCSICERNGLLLIYPQRSEIEWLSGWDTMSSYTFATHTKVQRFCGTCGSSVAMDFLGLWKAAGDVVGINVSFLLLSFNIMINTEHYLGPYA
jgi:hypothetical protein